MNTHYSWIFIRFCAIKIILQLYNTGYLLIVIEIYRHSIKKLTNKRCFIRNYKNENKMLQ